MRDPAEKKRPGAHVLMMKGGPDAEYGVLTPSAARHWFHVWGSERLRNQFGLR
jgi:hypothetical protein